MSSYFELFGLSEDFSLDIAHLDRTYHTLVAQFHPDKFASQSTFEQKQAMMMSATINQAYTILRHPLERAAYILQQQHINPDDPHNTHVDPDFLMQQMLWRETLADARDKNDTASLKNLHIEIDKAYQSLLTQLTHHLAMKNWQAASDDVRRGRFLNKTLGELDDQLS